MDDRFGARGRGADGHRDYQLGKVGSEQSFGSRHPLTWRVAAPARCGERRRERRAGNARTLADNAGTDCISLRMGESVECLSS